MTNNHEPTACDKRYVLHPMCQVRREAFGLLFYDLRGPKLLFAGSGALLEPEALESGVGLNSAAAGFGAEDRRQVASLLATLVEKGFLREQPIC